MVDIILPTLGLPHLSRCLKAIEKNTEVEYRLDVVKEGRNWRQSVNIGLKRARPGADIVVMDDDIVVSKGWLAQAMIKTRKENVADIVGYQLTNPQGNVQQVGAFLIPGSKVLVQSYTKEVNYPFYCPHVTFSLIFLKREVVDSVGLIDEQSFDGYQFEDVDYTHRALLQGYRIMCIPHKCIHLISETKKTFADFERMMDLNRNILISKWENNDKLIDILKKYVPPHIIEQQNKCRQDLKEQKPPETLLPPIQDDTLSADNELWKVKSRTASIVIPVFNNVKYTKQCLKTLIENTPNSRYEVIIVDNGSTDDTGEILKCLQGSVKIISNRENLGFSKACNQGAAAADGNYLVFLNNDTVVQPGWLEALIEVLENDPEVGAVGCKLLYPDGSIQHAGVVIIEIKGIKPLSATHIFRQQPQDKDFVNVPMFFQAVTAACMALRKSDFQSVGGFDESFWNGFEDVDLCFKLLKSGKKIVYQPKSVVIHYESKGGEERFKKTRQNFNLLLEKWIGEIEADIVINGNQVQEGISNAIQPYEMRDSIPIISRSHYMNAAIQWVKYCYLADDRLPVKKLRFAIKTCTPSRYTVGWGDTYFANSLAKTLVNFGHKCEVHFQNEWEQLDNYVDIVIHVAGLFRYTPKPYNFNILWIINHPELHTFEEISLFDVVFCASKPYLDNLKNNINTPCFYLPQVTDDKVFNPSKNNSTKDIDILFVGNNYYKGRKCRQIIQDFFETGKQYDLYVVGQGWRNIIDDRYIKAEFVEWEKLPQLYARAKIVLNDHQESMRQLGFVNNRTFDLAALKAFQISNYVQGIEEFGIVTYKNPQDLAKKLDYFLQNEKERDEFAQISNELCADYTYENAARVILSVINTLFKEMSSVKSHGDIQNCCAKRQGLCDLRITDAELVHPSDR